MKKRQIQMRWFISFFLILLISMIPAALIYHFSIDAIEVQAIETNRAHQTILEQTLESVVDDVDRMMDALTVNTEFAFIRSVTNPLPVEQRWRMYKFSKDTFRYMLLDDTYVKQRYVYLKNSDILVGKSYLQMNRAYESGWLGTSMPPEEWKRLMNETHTRTYIPATLDMKKGFFYLRSMRSPTARSGEYDAVLIMFISNQAVSDVLMEGKDTTESVICVLDEKDRLLLSNVDDEAASAAVKSARHEQSVTLGGRQYFCQMSYNENSGLKYICYSSYETAYRQVKLVKRLSLLFLAAGLMIGVMVAAAMTRRHYKPVKKIISRLEEAPVRTDEYDTILSYIETNQSKRESLQKQLAEKQAFLQQAQLSRFLMGGMQWNADTLRMLAGCHIATNRAAYAVAVINMSEFSAETGRNMAHNVAELMREILTRRMPGLTVYETMIDVQLLALLLGMEAEEGVQLSAQMHTLEEELRTSYRMEMAVGLSNVAASPEQMPELYRQAAAALEFAQMHPESRVVCYPQAAGNVLYSYPLEKEMLLVQAVSNGQAEQAMEILDGVYDMVLHQPSIVMQECLRVDLVATCLRIFAIADKMVSRESWEGYGAARRLMAIRSLPELFAEIRAVITRLCGVLAGQKEQGRQGKETQSFRIREMIEAYWQESELSVGFIAEKMNLHPSYVSRLFKEEQGMGMLEFINRYRIEQACRLLLDTTASVSGIAARCGYTSDASFIRVFRQYRGITPGKYREEAKKA